MNTLTPDKLADDLEQIAANLRTLPGLSPNICRELVSTLVMVAAAVTNEAEALEETFETFFGKGEQDEVGD